MFVWKVVAESSFFWKRPAPKNHSLSLKMGPPSVAS